MTNRIFRPFLAAVVPVILLSSPVTAKKWGDEEAVQFLNQVRAKIDIRSDGTPPFILRARVEIAPLDRGQQRSDGFLVLTWLSRLQWQEEISFPGFKEVRVASQGKLWTVRSVGFEPVRIGELVELIDPRSKWTLNSDESIVAAKLSARRGNSMECVSVKPDMGPGREVCADRDTLLPVRITPPGSGASQMPSYEYADYRPWGSHQFPHVMRVYEGKGLVVEATAELSSAPDASPSLFDPPAQAVEWEWCDNMSPPRELSTAAPHYPEAEWQNRREGVVSVYAVIGTDGAPQNLAIVRSAGRDFDAATLASVRQWRYQPAICGRKPVPSETIIDVWYKLSY